MRGAIAVLAALATLAAAWTPAPARAQTTLRVVAYNIKHGRGMDDRVDLERIADVLRRLDADVITLQEVDDRTERTGGVDQARRIAELLGMRGFHGPHREYQGGWYGNAILTRLPVRNVRTRAIPPAAGSDLAVHEVEVAGPGGTPISIVSVHLAGAPEERRLQADSLDAFFEETDHPVVLAGDFNSRRGDLVMRRLARRWEILDKTGPADTYPSPEPDREIDFVLVRPPGRLQLLEHVVIDEPMASDHRPLLAVFRIW